MTDLKNRQKARLMRVNTPPFRKLILTVGSYMPIIGPSKSNPKLKDNQHVMFLPDIAYQQDDGHLVASIQAWVYEKQRRPGLTQLLALFLGIDLASLTVSERQKFYERTQLFRVDSAHGKQLLVSDPTDKRHSLPRTKRSGRTNNLLNIDQLELEGNKNQKIVFQLKGIGKPADHNKPIVYFAPKNGLSIISDIDDTIKETQVGKTKRVLINTFLEEFLPIDGMSEWYNDLANNENIAFHYVSSSPMQLYPLLQEFMTHAGYPEGSIHLRETTRWTEIMPRTTKRLHKPLAIERLVKAYPNRHFILIGDSAEHDPIIYANFMRQYHQQIIGICIRDVSSDTTLKNYHKIFADIAQNQWLVSNCVEKMRHQVNQWRLSYGY